MYDRTSLIRRLEALSLPEGEYWVVAGAAMVLHGFRAETRDIDLGCSARLADRLERQGYPVARGEDGLRTIRLADDAELFENWLEGAVERIGGVPVVSADGLIRMKRKLGRAKDWADIALIEAAVSAARQT